MSDETTGVVVALDLGGTWIKGFASSGEQPEFQTSRGRIRRWPNPLADAPTATHYAHALATLCRELAGSQPIRAVVAATAGEVDAAGHAYLIAAAHLGVLGAEPWRAAMANELGCPVTLINDGEAFVLGLAATGQLPLRGTIGAMVVGTGLGFVLVRDGRWWKPSRRLPLLGCAWTADGNYDDWASAVRTTRRTGVELETLLGSSGPATERDAYLGGLARIAASATALYHLDHLVLGGGLADAAHGGSFPLAERIAQTLPGLLPPRWPAPSVELAPAGNALLLHGVLAYAAGLAVAEKARYRGDFKRLPTEQSTEAVRLENMSSSEVARTLAEAEHAASGRFLGEAERLGAVADQVARALREGGRVIYAGAGTSGRIGALDAVEIPCTYGLEPDRFVAVIAGGVADAALTVEGGGEEDVSAVPDLLLLQLTPRDVLIGLSASGTAFFVRSALAYAAARGCTTVLIREGGPDDELATDFSINLHSGPELVHGSTRMKAGTATKKAVNVISTTAMVKLGKVRQGRMVDLVCSNDKLRARAEDILMHLTGVSAESARDLLSRNSYNLRAVLENWKKPDT